MSSAQVGIIMGSQSDWATMKHAADVLDELGVAYETRIVVGAPHAGSAVRVRRDGRGRARPARDHRRRRRRGAPAGDDRGEDAAAGARRAGAEQGAVRAWTRCCRSSRCREGIPVGTLAIGEAGAVNAGLLAAAIVALGDPAVARQARRVSRARRPQRVLAETAAVTPLAARRDDRRARRRPARPHDGDRRAPDGLPDRRARSEPALPDGAGRPTASSSARSTISTPRATSRARST